MGKHAAGDVTKDNQRIPFKAMDGRQKVVFILKLAACIITFGMIFPNVMGD